MAFISILGGPRYGAILLNLAVGVLFLAGVDPKVSRGGAVLHVLRC